MNYFFGFVSYGGISGGTRAVQLLKPVVTGLKMMPLLDSVIIPFFNQQINPDGSFIPTEAQIKDLLLMFTELVRWSRSLSLIKKDQEAR